MRVAVVGCGVVGACVGWHLARRGVEVMVIDAGQPGGGVSEWTFSWVNASNKTATRAYFELNVAGMAAHREMAADLGPDGWFHPTGNLRWVDDLDAAEALHRTVDLLRSWGYDAAAWDTDRARRLLEPEVRFATDVREVAVFGDEGWIDGRRLVGHLVDDAVSRGAEVRAGAAVTDIGLTGDHVAEVVLADGHREKVDAVVNAAGTAASEVAGFVGRALPMRDGPGLVARFRCDRVPIRRVLHSPHVALRPHGHDQVVLHSVEIDGLLDPPNDVTELSHQLHDLAADVVPGLRTAELVDARVAWRPIPLDGFPSVGGVDDLAGYYEAVTHSGITLAAILGRVLADEIVDGTVDPLVEHYRPAS